MSAVWVQSDYEPYASSLIFPAVLFSVLISHASSHYSSAVPVGVLTCPMDNIRSMFGSRGTQRDSAPGRQSQQVSTQETDDRQPTRAAGVHQVTHPQASQHGPQVARHSTHQGVSRPRSRVLPRVETPRLSEFSTPSVPNSAWFASDFMIGAGVVIVQPSTAKVVLLYDSLDKRWFLPKGRKDIGESLEQTALREAYEESGYRVEFLPVLMPTNAPPAPESPHRSEILPCTEPFYVSTLYWRPRSSRRAAGEGGGEYLTFWYLGKIPADAVHENNTGMPDEQGYQSHIMEPGQAYQILRERGMTTYAEILRVGYNLWVATQEIPEQDTEAVSATYSD